MPISAPRGFKGTYEEHVKYTNMRHIEDGETPTEWKIMIWDRLENKHSILILRKIAFMLTKQGHILLMGKNTLRNVEWLFVSHAINLYFDRRGNLHHTPHLCIHELKFINFDRQKKTHDSDHFSVQ